MMLLENWAVAFEDYYYPVPKLTGNVFGHDNFPAGHKVITSRIVSSEGRIVKTKNSVYKLGNICPKYKEYCNKNGIIIDENNPVKIKNDT